MCVRACVRLHARVGEVAEAGSPRPRAPRECARSSRRDPPPPAPIQLTRHQQHARNSGVGGGGGAALARNPTETRRRRHRGRVNAPAQTWPLASQRAPFCAPRPPPPTPNPRTQHGTHTPPKDGESRLHHGLRQSGEHVPEAPLLRTLSRPFDRPVQSPVRAPHGRRFAFAPVSVAAHRVHSSPSASSRGAGRGTHAQKSPAARFWSETVTVAVTCRAAARREKR